MNYRTCVFKSLAILILVCWALVLPLAPVSAASPTTYGNSWRPIPSLASAAPWYWKWLSSKNKPKDISSKGPATKEPQTPWEKLLVFWERLVSGQIKPGPRAIHQALYWITAADAVQSVLRNEYSSTLNGETHRGTFPSVYSKLFYFARLRPRLLYAVGALFRAVQLCTPIGRILDPSIGVGAGINLCAILASSRWVKPLILGFCTTKFVWRWLGARRVSRAFLPITLSIREWEDQKPENESSEDIVD